MKRPFSQIRPVGPVFEQDDSLIGEPDPNPRGSLLIARIDVTGHTDQSAGTVEEEFEENMINVVADAVAEATQPFSGAQGTIPINFDKAVMFQPFPVSVAQEFQAAILTMMYDENLVGQEADIEENIRVRTDRVERFDVIPV